MEAPLSRRTSREHDAGPLRVLLLPVGSFEQHGPHLPLTTDTIIAETICSDAAAICDVDVAPAFSFSASGEHDGFAGLLSLGTDATALALTELVRSARASWRGVVIVSGHGGNTTALARVADIAHHEGDRVACWVPRADDGDAHAGETETSVMLTIDASLVREDEVPADEPLPTGWQTMIQREGLRAVTASGVLGNPRRATFARGADLRRRWCAEVVSLVEAMWETA